MVPISTTDACLAAKAKSAMAASPAASRYELMNDIEICMAHQRDIVPPSQTRPTMVGHATFCHRDLPIASFSCLAWSLGNSLLMSITKRLSIWLMSSSSPEKTFT